METTDTKRVICQIICADDTDTAGRDCVTVEMRSSDPDQTDSMANLLTGWLAHNWDELFLLFRRQLKAHQQETTGTADVAASTAGPRLVNAEGTAYTSSDDQLDLFANTVPAIIMDDSYSAPRAAVVDDCQTLFDAIAAPAPAYEAPAPAPAACYDAPAPSPSYSTSYDCGSSGGSTYDSSSGSFDTSSSTSSSSDW